LRAPQRRSDESRLCPHLTAHHALEDGSALGARHDPHRVDRRRQRLLDRQDGGGEDRRCLAGLHFQKALLGTVIGPGRSPGRQAGEEQADETDRDQ
jgi:hypothetical protein